MAEGDLPSRLWNFWSSTSNELPEGETESGQAREGRVLKCRAVHSRLSFKLMLPETAQCKKGEIKRCAVFMLLSH